MAGTYKVVSLRILVAEEDVESYQDALCCSDAASMGLVSLGTNVEDPDASDLTQLREALETH